MKSTDKIYGIDLGTTNSCLAVLEGRPRVINLEGSGLVPSAVSSTGSEILIGRQALNRSLAYPEQSVRSVKRSMGTDRKFRLDQQFYEPEDISAMILKYLCAEAGKLEGIEVRRVIITVPAYFNESQRRATIAAGQKAGLTVERIVNEPTAAAVFYDHIQAESRPDKNWDLALVYDLGGGTFDVSILRQKNKVLEVLANTGDTQLGGDDFDRLLADYFLNLIRQEEKVNLTGFQPAVSRLTAVAEKTKIALSSKSTVQIDELMIPGPQGRTFSLSAEYSRPRLEAVSAHLLARTLKLVDQALSEASLRPADIDRVLLVGGMTSMPAVSRKLTEIFGQAQMPVLDPDRSVALGAAILGGLMTGEEAETVLVDVTSHTLSLKALNPSIMKLQCTPIIPRNTPVPAKRSQLFSTAVSNQEVSRLEVYQGESEDPRQNEYIGGVSLHLRRVNDLSPIEVQFSYDLNGLIHLEAEQVGFSQTVEIDLDTHNPQEIESEDFDSEPDMEDFFSRLAGLAEDLAGNRKPSRTAMEKIFAKANPAPQPKKAGRPPVRPASAPQETAGWNFAVKRAQNLLELLEAGSPDRQTLQRLLDSYTQGLEAEDEDLDRLEDELLDFMETIQ
ncbi:MAG: Hsp70 family protein [Deltaproteobacteria bacterium]|jgi:molecular chaperone DnaK|nr:Hsp70 family protein [Deltaproteobacteria bacterium]